MAYAPRSPLYTPPPPPPQQQPLPVEYVYRIPRSPESPPIPPAPPPSPQSPDPFVLMDDPFESVLEMIQELAPEKMFDDMLDSFESPTLVVLSSSSSSSEEDDHDDEERYPILSALLNAPLLDQEEPMDLSMKKHEEEALDLTTTTRRIVQTDVEMIHLED